MAAGPMTLGRPVLPMAGCCCMAGGAVLPVRMHALLHGAADVGIPHQRHAAIQPWQVGLQRQLPRHAQGKAAQAGQAGIHRYRNWRRRRQGAACIAKEQLAGAVMSRVKP